MRAEVTEVGGPDGRRIAVAEWGDPDGTPVLLLHGTPGCRPGVVPRAVAAARPDVRFLAYDRPGYGGSDRAPGRRVVDAARDAAAVADALGVERFAVLGRSGGAPHALACAALLPGRVRRVAAMVSLAPRDAAGLDWTAGMTEFNVREYERALTGPERSAEVVAERREHILRDPEQLLKDIEGGLTASDRRIIADPGVREMLLLNYREALRESADGWLDDMVASVRPWGFDPEAVTRPVLLWHGAEDTFSPVDHFHWLARRLPRVRPVLAPGAGHFGAIAALPEVLDWLTGERTDDPPAV
ncbi:alpha/beta fold hydrolase [Streptomyces sp. JNUCC 64]